MAIYIQPNSFENCQDQDFSKLWNSYNYKLLAHYLGWIYGTEIKFHSILYSSLGQLGVIKLLKFDVQIICSTF